MKYIKVLASLVLVFMLCSAFSLKGNKKSGVYVAGVSASFLDSVVYFTDVMFVDSVKIGKDMALPQRGQYSDQLENYLLQTIGQDDRTCFIYFSPKKEKLEKEMKKMKAKYQKGGTSVVKQVDASFKFTKPEEY